MWSFLAWQKLKECVTGFEMYARWVYLDVKKNEKKETVSKYRNDTYSPRITVVHCHLVFFAPPADLIPSLYLNSPLTHTAIVCTAEGVTETKCHST